MTPMTLPALTAHSLSDQAYRALRTAIVNGDLPWGKKITERGLAESLGVSPTPVREALRRLEQEQLVERTGPRTLTVATVSPEARTECGIIEAALEGFAAEKATERQLAGMERLLDTADEAAVALQADRSAGRPLNPHQVERIFDAVRAFHSAVEEAAGNAQLARALEQVRAFSRSERLSIASAQLAASAPGPIQRYGQHREILTALQQRDAERAERLARTHAASGAADLAGWDA
jgi:DNA-binding GntR family transcriptional regulator